MHESRKPVDQRKSEGIASQREGTTRTDAVDLFTFADRPEADRQRKNPKTGPAYQRYYPDVEIGPIDRLLRKNLVNHVAIVTLETFVSRDFQFAGIDAHEVVDRGVDVGHVVGMFHRVVAELIR